MRPIKYAPQGQAVGSVLKLMLSPRGHKQDVACLEWVPLAVVKEEPSARE